MEEMKRNFCYCIVSVKEARPPRNTRSHCSRVLERAQRAPAASTLAAGMLLASAAWRFVVSVSGSCPADTCRVHATCRQVVQAWVAVPWRRCVAGKGLRPGCGGLARRLGLGPVPGVVP